MLQTEAILDRLTVYQDTMGEALEDNFKVWAIDEIQFGDGYLYEVSTYEEEDNRVRAWVEARLEWMDANIGGY